MSRVDGAKSVEPAADAAADDPVLYLIVGTALLQGSGLRAYFESGFQSRVLRDAWASPVVVALNVLGGVCSVASVFLAVRVVRRLASARRAAELFQEPDSAGGVLLVVAAT